MMRVVFLSLPNIETRQRCAPGGMRMRGQALAEFLVLALALMPLFLLMPVIARYQSISHATQLASRYVAFEAFVRNDGASAWAPESELADEVRLRFFSEAGAVIRTSAAADDIRPGRNLFWHDPRGNALIRDAGADVRVSFGFGNSDSHDGAFSSASDGAPFKPLHDRFDLRARGIYTANVSVKLANLPAGLAFYEPFDRIDLLIARSTSVVIDPWTANNPQQVESRIGANAAIFPAGALSQVSPVVDAAVRAIESPGGLSGPRLGKLDFWRDVVPQDRLKSAN